MNLYIKYNLLINNRLSKFKYMIIQIFKICLSVKNKKKFNNMVKMVDTISGLIFLRNMLCIRSSVGRAADS